MPFGRGQPYVAPLRSAFLAPRSTLLDAERLGEGDVGARVERHARRVGRGVDVVGARPHSDHESLHELGIILHHEQPCHGCPVVAPADEYAVRAAVPGMGFLLDEPGDGTGPRCGEAGRGSGCHRMPGDQGLRPP